LNASLGYWDIFWPQFIQGISLGLLFVPLTTITMDPILRENMGNATSIFNLMRNLGGSMGIAAATTLLSRHRQEHTSALGSRVDAYNPQVRALLEQMRAGFVARGADAVTAAQQARVALFARLQREAMMLSFTDIFRWLAFLFVAMVPLLLLMRNPRSRKAAEGAH
jgi:DHA2 family multidrug resistance protein